ncbi:MAG: sulfatase-like hydrolase/transferase [Steroidobacteraceae bacterium]
MRRRRVLQGLSAAVTAAVSPAWVRAAAPRRPNFLFIMADDLGWADLGCYGRTDVATPHLDALARAGARLEHGYANSCVCSATRVGLITGRYQYRLRVGLDEPTAGVDVGLEPGTPTLPLQLRNAGYQTSLVGKWHLGSVDRYSPLLHGYDRFWGLRGGGIDYFTHDVRRAGVGSSPPVATPDLWDGDAKASETGYLTDLIGDHGSREIARMTKTQRPFFLSLHFTAPHWPWEGPGDAALASDVGNALHFDGGTIATYRRMVESLDANVGKVLAALRASGSADDTIVVFTSDNGGERFSKTWPFNGMKCEVLEGGIRVPLIVSWPGRIKAGSGTDQVAISMDFTPTFLAAAGVPVSAQSETDGLDLLPALLEGRVRERDLYWRFKAQDQAALRSGRWKYLRMAGAEFLFDIVADPQERGNLKTHEVARFETMKKSWADWNATMLPYPLGSPSWDNKAQKSLPDRY